MAAPAAAMPSTKSSTTLVAPAKPAAARMAKTATKRSIIIEPLFTHVVAESMPFEIRPLCFRGALPALARVSFPVAGGIVAINVSISSAVKIALFEGARRHWLRNVRMKVAVVTAESLHIAATKSATGVGVKVCAPIV